MLEFSHKPNHHFSTCDLQRGYTKHGIILTTLHHLAPATTTSPKSISIPTIFTSISTTLLPFAVYGSSISLYNTHTHTHTLSLSPPPSSELRHISPSPIHDAPPAHSEPPPPTVPIRTHHMHTRLETGTRKPKKLLNLSHTLQPAKPITFRQALTLPYWKSVMQEEILALKNQNTWSLFSLPSHQSIIGSRWTFKIKSHFDGTIARYKAHLVAQPFKQIQCIDYTEAFSPVTKFPTIRLLLTLTLNIKWTL